MSVRRAIHNYVNIINKNETVLTNLGISLRNKVSKRFSKTFIFNKVFRGNLGSSQSLQVFTLNRNTHTHFFISSLVCVSHWEWGRCGGRAIEWFVNYIHSIIIPSYCSALQKFCLLMSYTEGIHLHILFQSSAFIYNYLFCFTILFCGL